MKNKLVLLFFVCFWRGLNKVTLQHMGCPKQKNGMENLKLQYLWKCMMMPKVVELDDATIFFMNT